MVKQKGGLLIAHSNNVISCNRIMSQSAEQNSIMVEHTDRYNKIKYSSFIFERFYEGILDADWHIYHDKYFTFTFHMYTHKLWMHVTYLHIFNEWTVGENWPTTFPLFGSRKFSVSNYGR